MMNSRTILIEAGLTTTIHALPNILRTKYTFLKMFWLFIFLLLSSLCFTLIINNIQTFFQYETVTKTTVNYQVSTEFPTVTICNQNPFVSEQAFLKFHYEKVYAVQNSFQFSEHL